MRMFDSKHQFFTNFETDFLMFYSQMPHIVLCLMLRDI